jgi:seryl-tRNA synthetase
MHDIKWIRENSREFDKGLERRGLEPFSAEILNADAEYRVLQQSLQALQSRRNEIAAAIGLAKRSGENVDSLTQEGAEIRENMPALEGREKELKEKLYQLLTTTPNTLLSEVPTGKDEKDNVVIRVVGSPRSFSFPPKEHFDLGEASGMMNFEQASQMSGSRFVILKKHLALLQRALSNFMLDLHTQEFGYEEVSPPLLVNESSMFGAGQLPKFAEGAFQTTSGHWLIPTSEVPLTCWGADRILDEEDLPLRFVAHTPCFRSEAGAAGRDTRGMLRQHQFYKVELVSFVKPEEGLCELERMVNAAEEVLKKLEIPYRVVSLCEGDVGFHSTKTYDLEAWLPGQNAYREISSCSLCGDFQARRMNARFRGRDPKEKPQFPYTLNGSGIAVGRALIAVLENYQQENGSIQVPRVLIPYMNGLTEI